MTFRRAGLTVRPPSAESIRLRGLFDRFSTAVSHGSGHPLAFIAACGLIVVWAVTGPLFGFSETWQLVVNTATTIVTFLMVFVLQHTQNRDGAAVQAKLDELIVAIKEADNAFVGADRLSDKEVEHLRKIVEERLEAAPAADSTPPRPRRRRQGTKA